jgi:DNA-binding transcriptional MerR regulator
MADVVPLAPGTVDEQPTVEYTIDELATLTAVPKRTIRYYQSKGTLAHPERRGRVGFYSQDHVERLRLIIELQDRGLTLDAIRDVLDRASVGGGAVFDWLGIGDRLQAPWSDDRPVVLSEDEVLERFGSRRPGILATLARVRLVQRHGDSRPASYLVASPGLFDIAARLDAAGIDPETASKAADIIRERMGRAADELVTFFTDHIGEGFGGDGEPDEVLAAFEAIRPQAGHAVQLLFAQEMERVLRTFVETGGPVRAAARRDKR